MTRQQRRNGQKYGYGIVDRHGTPWWDEACVCEDRGPLLTQVNDMNSGDWSSPEDDARAPFRVVRLFWKATARKGRRRG